MNTMLGMVLVLGVMIMVHEWGHYIIARLFKVRVDVFSVGFGPRLFGIKRGATDWRLSAIPLGGYVRMAGQDLSEVDSNEVAPTGAADELMSKPRWQRALISFAGPAVNLVFPLFLLGGFFAIVGIPYSAYMDHALQVVAMPANSPVTETSLLPGDHVVSINGVPSPSWGAAEKILHQVAPDAKLQVEVERGGSQRSVEVDLKDPVKEEHPFGLLPIRPILDDVEPGKPAARAGIREGDLITAVDGKNVAVWEEFKERIQASNGKALQLDLIRNGKLVHVAVTPALTKTESGQSLYQLGVLPKDEVAYRKVSLIEGAKEAKNYTALYIERTVGVVGSLVVGKISVRQLQSVVGISRAAGQAVSRGPLSVILLMSFMSVNLGILNLLPIPILDGGNILLLALEGIRRRDFSLGFKERFVQVGLVFLLVLFAIVMYNDVARLLPFHS
jgi:regulator of sigma E protease